MLSHLTLENFKAWRKVDCPLLGLSTKFGEATLQPAQQVLAVTLDDDLHVSNKGHIRQLRPQHATKQGRTERPP